MAPAVLPRRTSLRYDPPLSVLRQYRALAAQWRVPALLSRCDGAGHMDLACGVFKTMVFRFLTPPVVGAIQVFPSWPGQKAARTKRLPRHMRNVGAKVK